MIKLNVITVRDINIKSNCFNIFDSACFPISEGNKEKNKHF